MNQIDMIDIQRRANLKIDEYTAQLMEEGLI